MRNCKITENKVLSFTKPEYLRIEGEGNFFLRISTEGRSGTTNSEIEIIGFGDKEFNRIVDIKVRWHHAGSKSISSLLSEENHYFLSPVDINRSIIALVEPLDRHGDFFGRFEIRYGPIKLEKGTHAGLSNAIKDGSLLLEANGNLGSYSSRFSKLLAQPPYILFLNDYDVKVGEILISRSLKFKQSQSERKSFKIFSDEYPSIEIVCPDPSLKDTCLLFLQFHRKTGPQNPQHIKLQKQQLMKIDENEEVCRNDLFGKREQTKSIQLEDDEIKALEMENLNLYQENMRLKEIQKNNCEQDFLNRRIIELEGQNRELQQQLANRSHSRPPKDLNNTEADLLQLEYITGLHMKISNLESELKSLNQPVQNITDASLNVDFSRLIELEQLKEENNRLEAQLKRKQFEIEGLKQDLKIIEEIKEHQGQERVYTKDNFQSIVLYLLLIR